MYTAIGNDPGYRNYGYAVIRVAVHRKIQINIVEIGLLTNTITNLTEAPLRAPRSKQRKHDPVIWEAALSDQMAAYSDTIQSFHEDYAIDGWFAERFQTRGIKGKSIEAVTTMNAVAYHICMQRQIVARWFTASSWKNTLNRVSEVEGWYNRGLTPHSVDSMWIAVYGALQHHGCTWSDVDFQYIANQLARYTP